MRMFSAQYGITTTPRVASGSASGLSMTIFGAGSVPVSGITPDVLHVVAVCEKAVLAHRITTATVMAGAVVRAACFILNMVRSFHLSYSAVLITAKRLT